jgi:hypothetical protein
MSAWIETYCDIQEQLARFMFTSPDAGDWRLFMARMQAGEGPAAAFSSSTNTSMDACRRSCRRSSAGCSAAHG